jgi:hypothetical protein
MNFIEEGDRLFDRSDYVRAEAMYAAALNGGISAIKPVLDAIIHARKANAIRYRKATVAKFTRVASIHRVRTRASVKLDNDEFKEDNCAVCLVTYPSVTILPCNHRCVCIDCSATMLTQRIVCPLCNIPIDGIRIWD